MTEIEMMIEPDEAIEMETEEVIQNGGGGGTSDYNMLQHLPQINGTTLKGNKSLQELGITQAIGTEVDKYVADHKAELKGDPGTPGHDGDDGFSPSAKVERVADGAKISITDKDGTTEVVVKDGTSLPSFSASDNGKVLGIVNGVLAWVDGGTPTPTPTDVVEVGIGDAYTYHTIKEAENAIADGGKILIHEGTYEEYGIGTTSKAITYEGVNKETCIVQNGLSDKMYSVFDLTGGNKTVKNLTIHQTHSNPQNPDTSTVAYKAYGIHCDSPSNSNHSYTIENCIVKNKYFACCGFGLWQDHTITVKDCDLDWYDNRGSASDYGTYYCHNNTYSDNVTGQKIVLINNTIHADQSKTIRIDGASQIGSEMICEFINNTCNSELYGTDASSVQFSTNEHTILTETSIGNNIPKLNYETPSSYVAPDGLKDTGYWFVAFDKTANKYYAVNSVATITDAHKLASTSGFAMTITNGNAKNNGWVSDDGQTWEKKLTDYIQYKTEVNLKNLSTFFNNQIELVDAWSDTEFTWNYA